MSLCVNCNTHSHEDVEVISNLVRIRIKTKPTINHFVLCIRYGKTLEAAATKYCIMVLL